MKKAVYITLFALGILFFSSCRSTAKRCGLAENQQQIQQNFQQDGIVAVKTIL